MRLVVVGVVALLAASPQPRLEARFIGNMAVAISDGSVTLMTDFPYQSGYSRYMTYPAAAIRSSTPATLALISHRHLDHWEPALFSKTDWKVAGPTDVVAHVSADRVLPLAGTASFGPAQIEPLATPHAGVGHYSYIVSWHGKRLYFSGDTESTQALVAARNLDVAFISPWIFQSVTRAGQTIDAKRIVIYHHEAGEQIPECRDRCSVPQQGGTIPIP
jgi:L-ascorbate metabolism protein UlaG (beta-lactamase superfamily)